ncbi:MAG: hypothetical protein JW807_04710 [Spirochaetes bacterium]|nr:hypothetical protein [Spirochaetota bacterium]
MKNVIIRINDIADIDTSKISVYDLNNRYIDSHGTMYGLKYNKSLRKIEVIKIVRTHEKNAASFQQKIIQKKRDQDETTAADGFASSGDGGPMAGERETYNAEAFIEKTIELMHTHRERLKGIMMNIRNSNIIPKDNKTESNQLEDIFRNIDIDGIQAFENLSNYQKELASYPRSLTYYQAKMDERGRTIIDTLAGSNRKVMRFIYLAEMLDNIRHLYKNIDQMTKQLRSFLEEKNPDEAKWASAHEKQSFKDGLVSINTTITEIEALQDDLVLLEEYTYNLDHYA